MSDSSAPITPTSATPNDDASAHPDPSTPSSHDDAPKDDSADDAPSKPHDAHLIGNKLAMLLNGSIERGAFSDKERDQALAFCNEGAALIAKKYPRG